MVSVSLHDLGIDRLSIEERLQVAEAIWDSVFHDVEAAPLPDWQKAELERRLADSVANPDFVTPASTVRNARDPTMSRKPGMPLDQKLNVCILLVANVLRKWHEAP